MKSSAYRPEIEGLRALAVSAVVLFHFKPEWLEGGFVGVDVFFVISGFLITSIIVRQIDAGTFSFKEFWLRRVRRLFPALAVVLTCSVIAGYLTLFGEQWVSLGSQVVSVLLLIGNIEMWQIANDYWGQSAGDVPLLHTWSLAIEEQFYLFFPLGLVILMKKGSRIVLLALILALLTSLAISIYGTPRSPSAIFYLLPSRGWELLIGSLLGFILVRRSHPFQEMRFSSTAATAGLALIAASFFIIDGSTGFPGYKALFPTVGAGLILAFTDSRRGSCLATRILSFPACTYIGRISYSLYLWHWPLLVYSQWYSIHPVWGVVASLILASLSYHFIEAPFRTNLSLQRYIPFAAILLLTIALPISLGKMPSKGLPSEISFIADPEASTRGREFEAKDLVAEGGNMFGGKAEESPELVVIGSSHARMFGLPFSSYAVETNTRLSMLGCVNLAITNLESATSLARLKHLEKWKPAIVVVAGRWEAEIEEDEGFETSLRTVLKRIASTCQHCIVLSQVPLIETTDLSRQNLKKYLVTEYRRTGSLPLLKELAASKEANRVVASVVESLDLPGLQFLSLSEPLNQDTGIRFIEDSKLLYDDHNHLNNSGAEWVFRQRIRPLLEKLRAENLSDL
ncbi:MAG: acyltransferase family protein [Verrucomicrobia bacterium]|nr:acyltransferase family protein [Verrucomicrobiota bacterium]